MQDGINLNKCILIQSKYTTFTFYFYIFLYISIYFYFCIYLFSVIEIFWSSHQSGSLIQAVNNISDILGIPKQPLSSQISVNRVHAGSNNRNSSLEAQEKSDQEYRKIMKYDSNPHFKIYNENTL